MTGRKVVVFAPNYDRATRITRGYAEHCISYAQQIGRQVVPLLDSRANPREVDRALRDPDVVGFDAYDHGVEWAVFGQENSSSAEVLFYKPTASGGISTNADLLVDKGAEILACHTARGLGPGAVKLGCDFYLGYVGVAFAIDNDEDREALTTAKRLLYDRHTAMEAFQTQKKAVEARYRRHRDTGNRDLASYQRANWLRYVLIGNEASTWT